MYKRKHKTVPYQLSLSSKKEKSAKPTNVCEVVVEINNENDSGTVNDVIPETDSEAMIPASQQAASTTQRRYFSQRSNCNRSQSINQTTTTTARKVPSSYFENTLLRCGATFDNPQYIILGCDHIAFVAKLRTMLDTAPDFPENVDRFLAGLREYMEKDEQQMNKMLTVCMINLPNCDFLPQSQDSLMRNFLVIDFLETKIVELFLDLLTNICSQSNPTDQSICTVILILTQLGFVNKIKHADLIYKEISPLLGLTEDVFRNSLIRFLPEILDVKKHDCVVETIISSKGSDPIKYLNGVTVNSFEAMQLSPVLRTQLKLRMLKYIQEENAPVKLYPPFVKFLLNCHANENCVELITMFRKIDWTREDDLDSAAVNEMHKAVFQFILRALKRSRELSEGWLKSIMNASRVEDCFPIDVVMLIIMSTINEDRSLFLENVLRRKLKFGWITREIFGKGITGYPSVIAQHLKVFFEFIDNLFRAKDDLFEFGEIGYKLAFGIPNCDHKLLLSKLIAFVCEKNNEYVVRRALLLLQEICQDYPEEVQNNSLQILRILDKVHDVGLFEYRLIMDLLSSIAYPPPPALPVDGIASHIDILVRKQVTGSGTNVRRQGIVGSVRVVDHLVWHADLESAEDDRDTEVTIVSLDELPEGNAKSAGTAVTLMFLSSDNSSHNRALCFDELAAAFSPRMLNSKKNKFLNKPFLSWFCDTVTVDFQDIYTVDHVPFVDGIVLEKKFELNREEEYTEDNSSAANIAINIAGLVLAEEHKTQPVISSLSPIFNLMRILHFHRCNGNLESINAVLGCPIIFPQFNNSPEDIMLDNVEQRIQMMDILFYTANWFREVVCAFATQRELNIRKKVLMRLADLISLERNIRNLMPTMPRSYNPPPCHFMSLDKNDVAERLKKSAKLSSSSSPKKKDDAGKDKNPQTSLQVPNNSTLMTGNQTLGQSRVEEKKNGLGLSLYGSKEIYRQLDPDIMMLLNEALSTNYPLKSEQVGRYLGLDEYQFILVDLILKLESVTGTKKSGGGFDQEQFFIFSVALIYDMKQFLGRFMQFLEQISTAILKNQELAGEDTDSSCLYSDEMGQLKTCFGLTLRLLAALFSWQGFHQEKHQELLKKSLSIVIGQSETAKDMTVKKLCTRVANSMIARLPSVTDLNSAVHLHHLLVALSGYTNDFSKSIDLCEEFLGRQWNSNSGAVASGSEANTMLNELLKGLFRNADFKLIDKHIQRTLEDVASLNGKAKKLKDYPNFNKSNFAILFRALINSLLEFTVQRLDQDLTTLMKLELWENVYEAQHNFLDMVKSVKVLRLYTLFLKFSQMFLKLFLQHGMPMVEKCLKTHKDRVITLLRSVQVTTRFLHNLCCQSKSAKQAGIVALIPGLRQSVESFNYSVKGALAANNCSSAFWLGNLRNKDLQGEDILSQVVSSEEKEKDAAAEKDLFPSDDETVDGSYLGITTMCHPTPAKEPEAGPSKRRRTTKNRK